MLEKYEKIMLKYNQKVVTNAKERQYYIITDLKNIVVKVLEPKSLNILLRWKQFLQPFLSHTKVLYTSLQQPLRCFPLKAFVVTLTRFLENFWQSC